MKTIMIGGINGGKTDFIKHQMKCMMDNQTYDNIIVYTDDHSIEYKNVNCHIVSKLPLIKHMEPKSLIIIDKYIDNMKDSKKIIQYFKNPKISVTQIYEYRGIDEIKDIEPSDIDKFKLYIPSKIVDFIKRRIKEKRCYRSKLSMNSVLSMLYIWRHKNGTLKPQLHRFPKKKVEIEFI